MARDVAAVDIVSQAASGSGSTPRRAGSVRRCRTRPAASRGPLRRKPRQVAQHSRCLRYRLADNRISMSASASWARKFGGGAERRERNDHRTDSRGRQHRHHEGHPVRIQQTDAWVPARPVAAVHGPAPPTRVIRLGVAHPFESQISSGRSPVGVSPQLRRDRQLSGHARIGEVSRTARRSGLPDGVRGISSASTISAESHSSATAVFCKYSARASAVTISPGRAVRPGRRVPRRDARPVGRPPQPPAHPDAPPAPTADIVGHET